jgi:hypothetical protein
MPREGPLQVEKSRVTFGQYNRGVSNGDYLVNFPRCAIITTYALVAPCVPDIGISLRHIVVEHAIKPHSYVEYNSMDTLWTLIILLVRC